MNSIALYQDINTRQYEISVTCGKEATVYTYADLRSAVKFFLAMVRDEVSFARLQAAIKK